MSLYNIAYWGILLAGIPVYGFIIWINLPAQRREAERTAREWREGWDLL